MSNLVPFEQAGIPAFVSEAYQPNSDMLAHAPKTFPILSIKGKVFTYVQGDTKRVVPNPRDPESPATFVDVHLVKVSPHKSKSYYANAFSENAEDMKPTCFSNNGETPDPSVQNPVCKSCKTCPYNQFGTARDASGNLGKGKACSDFVRVAISANNVVDEPMLLRVPPASIKNLGEYGTLLERRKVPYQAVLTRIQFDVNEATPRLLFKPLGFVDEATFLQVEQVAKSEIVDIMINGAVTGATTSGSFSNAPTLEEQRQINAKAKEMNPPASVREQAADEIINKTVEAVVESDDDLDSILNSLGV